MMKIFLETGTAFLEVIEVKGSKYDDLLGLIDEYYEENGDLPVNMYTYDELDFLDVDIDEYLGINGGEFYIEGISHVQEMEEEVEDDDMYYSQF